MLMDNAYNCFITALVITTVSPSSRVPLLHGSVRLTLEFGLVKPRALCGIGDERARRGRGVNHRYHQRSIFCFIDR